MTKLERYLDTLPIVQAFWWFIENVNQEDPEHNMLFSYLRRRYRQEVMQLRMASENPRPQPGSRGAYLISETMNDLACRMWDAYVDCDESSNGIDQDDASQLAQQVNAAYLKERGLKC